MILPLDRLTDKYNMRINGVIHIGAHLGEEHELYNRLGIKEVVYFEPIVELYNQLINKVGDSKVFNYALGNDNKVVEMYMEVDDKYGCSSVLQPSSNYDSVKFDKQTVTMKRLDDFNFDRYNMLNIDVQGFELEVLKGGERTLNKIDYIICEINRVTPNKGLDYINSSVIEDVSDYLSSYGFSLVEQDWAGLSWGDGLFIKNV